MAPPTADAIQSLTSLVDSAVNLVKQLQSALDEIQKSISKTEKSSDGGAANSSSPAGEPKGDPLVLARDSATLIRAHATKLSLLVITEPLTPSAIATVIRELVSGPLTGLATSIELCEPQLYTLALKKELLWRSQRIYVGLLDLLQKIPRDGKILTGKAKEGGHGSLESTGVLWSACDSVKDLSNKGVSGFYVDKVEEWRDTLKDIMEELREWGEEEGDDEDDEDEQAGTNDLSDKLQSTHLSAQEMVDDLMDSNPAIPRNDPDGIRPRLDSALKRLRLVIILYQAITKRRMKKLPKSGALGSGVITRLNEATGRLQSLPDEFGDLAAAFYELDPQEIDEVGDKCFEAAGEVGSLLKMGWDGEEDEFTQWVGKFREEVLKSGAS